MLSDMFLFQCYTVRLRIPLKTTPFILTFQAKKTQTTMLWNIQLFRAERILWCSTSQIDRRRLLAFKKSLKSVAAKSARNKGKNSVSGAVF